MYPVELRGARVVLREFRETDLTSIRVYASDPEVHRYMVWLVDEPADSVAWLRRVDVMARDQERTEYHLAVDVDGEHVGGAHLELEGGGQAQLGYVLRRDVWGQGLGPEAAGLACELAFETLGIKRIYARCDPRNTASSRVMEKLGMRREGFILNHLWIANEWRDSHLYGLVREEWDVFRSFADHARSDTQLELSLSRAAPKEIEQIHELMRIVGQDMLERFGMDHWEKPFNLAQMQFDACRRETYAVKDDEGIVGSFTIGFEPMWPSEVEIPFHEAARPLYLHRLMVHPKYQSRGVGALIMETAARLGRARGCDRIRLETRSTFTEVRRFYERMGYELRQDYHPEEDWCALDKTL